MRMRTAIVTGGRGFIGRHLVAILRRRGVAVTCLVRHHSADQSSVNVGEAPWRSAQIRSLIECLEPDVIFHLVGGAAGSDTEMEAMNLGTTRTLQAALRDSGRRAPLILCGSAAEYGTAIQSGVPVDETATCRPISLYGKIKLAQTDSAIRFAAESGTRVVITRIFNPIGPGMPAYLALSDFAKQLVLLQNGQETLQVGNIDVYRDFVDVNHIADAMIALAEHPQAQGIINAASGRPTSLRTLVQYLIAASGKTVEIAMAPDRMRAEELPIIIGHPGRLRQFGIELPPNDLPGIAAAIWRDAALRWRRS